MKSKHDAILYLIFGVDFYKCRSLESDKQRVPTFVDQFTLGAYCDAKRQQESERYE